MASAPSGNAWSFLVKQKDRGPRNRHGLVISFGLLPRYMETETVRRRHLSGLDLPTLLFGSHRLDVREWRQALPGADRARKGDQRNQ